MKVKPNKINVGEKIEIDKLVDWLNTRNDIYLYGAGVVCEEFLLWVEELELKNKIKGIIVTNKCNNADSVQNIPVMPISAIINSDSTNILLTVTERYYKEIANTLLENHINVFSYIDGDFLTFLYKDINRLKKVNFCQAIKKQNPKDKKYLDVLFMTPPHWDLYSPFSAVPSLVAVLKNEGYLVEQVDLGIKLVHYNLKKYWGKAKDYCLSKAFYEDNIRPYENNRYNTYEEYCEGVYFLNKSEFDISLIKKDYQKLDEVQRRALDALYQHIYTFGITSVDFDKLKSIREALESWDAEDFMESLMEKETARMLADLPDVVGISVTSREQFLPACLLAKFCKELNPRVKIIMGGSCADIFANSSYVCKKEIYEYFDYVIIGEGESAIIGLMDMLYNKTKEYTNASTIIPNILMINEHGDVGVTRQIMENVEELPPPDYSGLELDMYLSPEPVIPYQASRGCHYGYCAFCNHDEKYRHNYRMKSAKKVVNDMIHIHKEYNINNFQFVDEAIRPDHFREIVMEMDKHEECKKFKWIFYSRVSREYDEEILKIAKRNGCEMVMFGVETLNQRLLNFIRKGIQADTSKYSLKLFHENGIKTYAWLMCNLPSETIEEAKEDLKSIKEINSYIDAFSVGIFYLERNTDMIKSPEKFNITKINTDNSSLFESHFEGEIIDKDAMIEFFEKQYLGYQKTKFSCGNRYTLFFS